MPRPILLPALACALACGAARADCELLYAPPEIRARLLAFHHATELRRAREHARHDADRPRKPPQPGTAKQDRDAPARAAARPR